MLINFEQKIDPAINEAIITLKNIIEQAKITGITFMIPAYCSLTVGYDPNLIRYDELIEKIKHLENNKTLKKIKSKSRKLRIPVCYEPPYSLDLKKLSEQKGISIQKIIDLHTGQKFKVYMLGFLPGFVYMGKLPNDLVCNRKITPRLSVPANSVGLAGFQTGIYPSNSPGGWQIIGRTPLKIFNPSVEQPFVFQAGDEVTFFAISKEKFNAIITRNAELTD